MSNLDITKSKTSDYENTIENFEITPLNTDGISPGTETTYINPLWTKHWGYFNECPELKSAILMKAIWIVGKGYECDSRTQVILNHISGMGKDTFDDILFNMEVCRRVGRDSFAQIIRDKDTGVLLNLKVLDPSSIRIHIDGSGIIEHYEQVTKFTNKGIVNKLKNFVGFKKIIELKSNEVFHLSNNRLADQIHGISDIESLDKNLKADLESFDDTTKIMHRQARPFIIWKLKTDDETKINDFVTKISNVRNSGDDLFIPDDENLVTYEVVKLDPSAMVLSWRQEVKNRFYRALGLPQVIFGSANGGTESGSKVEYLAHEQVFEKDQRYLEKQIFNQLGLKIDLISPVSLLEALQQDETKDAQNAITMQQNDVTAGSGK